MLIEFMFHHGFHIIIDRGFQCVQNVQSVNNINLGCFHVLFYSIYKATQVYFSKMNVRPCTLQTTHIQAGHLCHPTWVFTFPFTVLHLVPPGGQIKE
ncbi:hypothetical protein JZ751_000159 [Albula glossodonta]|uniref:Uncharacterized protein n=1 Tax=Albula glossodonta TaxID=121402 RepID=A0A8T2PVG7_9TELE|nr:hypothetical protein JZ751_000159 [Albula glossodonta]